MRFELLKLLEEKGKREISLRSMSMKFGIAMAISLGGVIYYALFKKRRRIPINPSNHCDENVCFPDKEIMTKIKILEEKEQQILKLYEIKQREKALLEIQNQLRLRNMEAKMNCLNKNSLNQPSRKVDESKEVAELKRELEDVKKANEDLVQKLEYLQMLATSVANNDEVELREENEHLRKKVVKLLADSRSDTEELVYLRWVNACLRHQIQSSGNKKTKATPLILEHANDEPVEHNENLSAQKMKLSAKAKLLIKLKRLLNGKKEKSQFHDYQETNLDPEEVESENAIAADEFSDYSSGKSFDIPSVKSVSSVSSVVTSNGDAQIH